MQSLNFSRERQEDKKIWLTGSKEWREKIGSFYSSQFSWRHRRTRFLGHISSLLFVFAVPTYALCQHNWPTIDRRLAHDPVLFLSEKFYVKHISHLTCEFRFEENIAHPHKHTHTWNWICITRIHHANPTAFYAILCNKFSLPQPQKTFKWQFSLTAHSFKSFRRLGILEMRWDRLLVSLCRMPYHMTKLYTFGQIRSAKAPEGRKVGWSPTSARFWRHVKSARTNRCLNCVVAGGQISRLFRAVSLETEYPTEFPIHVCIWELWARATALET